MEASHKDPTTLPTTDPKNWSKNFEAIDKYFRGLRGYKKSPLCYVYCPDLVPALAAVDPPTGAAGSLHISHDDEMCARSPILLAGAVVGPDAETLGPFAPSFVVDRTAVWEKLAEILLTNDASGVLFPRTSRPLSARLVLIARRSQGERLLPRAVTRRTERPFRS
jgi:hypothetical protein